MTDVAEALRHLTDDVRRHYFADLDADPESIVAVLTRPPTPASDYGLLFVIADGLIGGCGEATMFAAVVRSTGVGASLVFDTTSGPITATDLGSDAVRLHMPAAKAAPRTHVVEGDGRELRVRAVSVAGNTFAAVAAADLGLHPTAAEAAELRREGDALLRVLVKEFASVSADPPGLLLLTEPVRGGKTRSACVWGDAILNTGPCGTGTCARVVLALEDGELTTEDELVQYSPFGHAFRARVGPDGLRDEGVVVLLEGEVSRAALPAAVG